jgi:hypothetical protein
LTGKRRFHIIKPSLSWFVGMVDDGAETPWPHQGSSVRPLPRTPLRPGVNGDHDGRPLAVSRRDRGLPRDQAGHGL